MPTSTSSAIPECDEPGEDRDATAPTKSMPVASHMPETQKPESKVGQPAIHTLQPMIALAKDRDANMKRTHISDSVLQPVFEQFCTSDFRPGILELCAGSATLSSVAAARGFVPVPVDYSRNKLNPKLPIIKLDLAEDYSVDICIDQISGYPVDHCPSGQKMNRMD
jgi:hypothetical protein